MEKMEAGSSKIIMEKATHTQTLSYSERRTYIDSDAFAVGGFSFKIRFRPHDMHTFIVNLNPDYLHTFFDIHFVDRRRSDPRNSDVHVTHHTFSSWNDRQWYRQVYTLVTGGFNGLMSDFKQSRYLRAGYRGEDDNSVTLRVTIGVFHRGVPSGPEFERCVFFRLGTCEVTGEPRLYYVEEAVVRRRCPALLDNVVISDVDRLAFEGVLWFMYNDQLHEDDVKRVRCSRAPEILAAADKFGFTDLVTQCESLISFGDSKVFDCSFQVKSAVKKFWNRALTKLSRYVKLD